MSDVSENELSDIKLCYKAMGLSFSDNPEQVEKTYWKHQMNTVRLCIHLMPLIVPLPLKI